MHRLGVICPDSPWDVFSRPDDVVGLFEYGDDGGGKGVSKVSEWK